MLISYICKETGKEAVASLADDITTESAINLLGVSAFREITKEEAVAICEKERL